MKILLAGDWHSELHEEVVFQALKKLGHEVYQFSWFQYFRPKFKNRLAAFFELIIKKAQNKYLIGPLINRLNMDLIEQVRKINPELLFVYRGTHIKAKTLKFIKQNNPQIVLAGYNNDDPFNPLYPFYVWHVFLKAIPFYDIIFAYRKHNFEDFQNHGAKEVFLLRSWYVTERNYPTLLETEEDKKKYKCDVVFIGHFEKDFRKEYLEALVKKGFHLNLFGSEWDQQIKSGSVLSKFKPVKTIWGKEYNKALCGAKIALCFFSKLNRDTYTRRNFEIPSTGTFMLSEFSEDMSSLFGEGVEADYFRNQEEFISKIELYLTHQELREKIAATGYKKVTEGKHNVVSRMEYMISCVNKIRNPNNR